MAIPVVGDILNAAENLGRGRILSMYGGRGGSIINATATGIELIISPSEHFVAETTVDKRFADLFKYYGKQSELHIAAFAPGGSPIRVRQSNAGGIKRALSGRVYGYRSQPNIEVDVAVIGNSEDYYRLTLLEHFYLTYRKDNTDRSNFPLINMRYQVTNCPGLNINLTDGMMTMGNLGVSITSSPRIEDKVFSFEFGGATLPSESDEKYGNGFLGTMLGF